MATFQPAPTSPTRRESGTTTSVRKTSLYSASPVIWRSGRTSIPGSDMSTRKKLRPAWRGTFGSVRARRMAQCPRWAIVVHTFWPETSHRSPSRTARVDSDARSEPAPGSLKSWHQISSVVKAGRRNRSSCVGVPWAATVGAIIVIPTMLTVTLPGAPAARSRSSTIS